MTSVAPPRQDRPSPADSNPTPDSAAPRNFLVLVFYQVLMRTGWIFKTESIIMPAVLDSLGGGAWLRSCLPLINRFGQSVPPLLMARQVKIRARKKWIMLATTLIMSVSFLGLALIWGTQPAGTWWMPIAFLSFYAVFFAGTGVNQLTFATLQGKLVQVTKRGRLLLMANVVGATTAITCAALLLPLWLKPDSAAFHFVFAFAGLCFAAAAVCAAMLNERPDARDQPKTTIRMVFAASLRILRQDLAFRRLAIVASLFGCSVMLFPHYQALGLRRLDLRLTSLIWWVVLQNAGTAAFSFFIGPLADARGNRLVLRFILLMICLSPLFALGLSYWPTVGRSLYAGVFILVGLTPVGIRVLSNYTLELAEPGDHPRYLSTLSLCLAVPVLFSPLAGLAIDLIGFEVIFLGISGVVACGWLMTFGLVEPRHQSRAETAAADS